MPSRYCFTIKQAGLIFIKNHLCTFAALIFLLHVFLFTRIHLSPLCNKPCHEFPTKFAFHHAYNLILSCWQWPLIILWICTFIKPHLCISCNIFVNVLTHKKAVCPYSLVLHYFHTYWTSYINILLKSNNTCQRYTGLFTGLFILTNSNNSFENGHPSLKFDFIPYLAYFPWFVFVAPNISHGLSKNPVLHELKKSLSSTHSLQLFLIWYLAWLKTSSNSFVQI